jgi:ATP-dependent RNA helicase DOB1
VLPPLKQCHVVSVSLSMIYAISSVRLHVPADVWPPYVRHQLIQALQQTCAAFADGKLPLLDPIEYMGVHRRVPFVAVDADAHEVYDEKVLMLARHIQSAENRLLQSPVHTRLSAAQRAELLRRFEERRAIATKVRVLKEKNKHSHITVFQNDLESRLRVLRRMGHLDKSDVILPKGRVAAEVESVDELVVTELIFDGVFNEQDPAVTCAMLTCMFDFEKSLRTGTRYPQTSSRRSTGYFGAFARRLAYETSASSR